MKSRVRRPRGSEAQLAFEALSIEGGLLAPEWLSRMAQLAAGGQSDADYRIPKGLNLRDEIGRYWRIAHAHWKDFEAKRTSAADPRRIAEHFVLALLRESFGFASLVAVPPVAIDERSFPIGHAALGGRVPVVIAAPPSHTPNKAGLDLPSPIFGDGGRRRSAFGLAQEYLNADDRALWGIASDGLTLRILRDNASLTRPAWVEADLARIFTEERYADFAALWLLAHETRFGREGQAVAGCGLEAWRSAGQEEGTRAREHLRRGVEAALVALGQGFLSHPENRALRTALQSGALPTRDYFQQLLRLVYRILFLLTVEERGLVHPAGANEKAVALFAEGYSLRRLRDRSVRRSAHDRFPDLWEGVKIVFRGLAHGEARLALPALAGLFHQRECSDLDAAKLENRALLLAVFKIAWLRDDGALARVNWRDMGPEELGSVYESLLELVPQITDGGRSFSFATGAEARGHARKTTGSYYTPDSLVQVLLDSALEPVITDTLAKHPDNPLEALLDLAIVDPACGSGHFLLAAARRLAAHVARLQAGGTPSAADYRHALRQVIGRCIYGVDLNPMAVELCKVALWMEAVEPGLPLTFLDSHIQHGNALLGATPELIDGGLPDAAWNPIEGDDKKTCVELKKRNKQERDGQTDMLGLMAAEPRAAYDTLAHRTRAIDAAPDDTLAALEGKAQAFERLVDSRDYRLAKLRTDAWCAAFVWPKHKGAPAEPPTTDTVRRLTHDASILSAAQRVEIERLAAEYRFFHWHLQFPQVFAKGGFDCVLGNPPWERVKLQEQEFFATRDSEIAAAPTAAARKKQIAKIEKTNPTLHAEFLAAKRLAEGVSFFLRASGAYPLTGVGDINTYPVFAERDRGLLAGHGRLGVILPTGIATDATTAPFFRDLVEKGALVSLYDFENRKPLFAAVDSRFKFCLLTLSGHERRIQAADFAFFAHDPSDLRNDGVRFSLTPEEIKLLNPNTGTCPVFRSRRDAEITLGIYRRVPVLINESDQENGNPWGIKFMRMFDMSNDSHLFHIREELEQDGWVLRGNVFERTVTTEDDTAFAPPPATNRPRRTSKG
jgi:hypothetical protein